MTTVDVEKERALAVGQLVDALVVCLMNARIYEASHPRVVTGLRDAGAALARCIAATKQNELTLGVVNGCIVHDGRPLIGASLSAKRLIDGILARGAGAIRLESAAKQNDLRALTAVLAMRRDLKTLDLANKRLDSEGGAHVRLLPPFAHGTPAAGPVPDVETATSRVPQTMTIVAPIQAYQSTVQLLQTITIAVCSGQTLGFETAQTAVETILGQMQHDAKSLLGMSRYEQYDAYTFGHSIRVCLLAVNFARHLGLDERLLNRIGVAALLHDIGKSKIPFEVLHCKSRLDGEQKRIMEQHSVLGAQILLDHHGSDSMCVVCAFGHHLTQGRGGYPKLQHQADLSLATRIVKLCDVYEALTAVRPYKESMSPLRAFRIMMSMRHHFDERLLRRFIEVNGIYPVGARVELTSGAEALIEAQNPKIHLPKIRIVVTPEGESLEAEAQDVIDLVANAEAGGDLRVRSILSESGAPAAKV